MNLYPFAAVPKSTREAIWPVIVTQAGFKPSCCYSLPRSFTHTQQGQAYTWSKENNIKLFLSVVLQLAVFANEDDAVLFKLTWL